MFRGSRSAGLVAVLVAFAAIPISSIARSADREVGPGQVSVPSADSVMHSMTVLSATPAVFAIVTAAPVLEISSVLRSIAPPASSQQFAFADSGALERAPTQRLTTSTTIAQRPRETANRLLHRRLHLSPSLMTFANYGRVART